MPDYMAQMARCTELANQQRDLQNEIKRCDGALATLDPGRSLTQLEGNPTVKITVSDSYTEGRGRSDATVVLKTAELTPEILRYFINLVEGHKSRLQNELDNMPSS